MILPEPGLSLVPENVYLKRAASYTPFVHKNCTKALLLLFIECVSKAAFLWSLEKGLGKRRHRFESARTFIGEQIDREELERRIYPIYIIYSLVDFSPWNIYTRSSIIISIHSKKGATRRNAHNNQQQHGCADASDPRRGFDYNRINR